MTRFPRRIAAATLSAAVAGGGLLALSSTAHAAPSPTSYKNQGAPAAPRADAKMQSMWRDSEGTPNKMPNYWAPAADKTDLRSAGSLWDDKGPLAGRTVKVYDYTNGERGKELGQETTDKNGKFDFVAQLPAGWASIKGFNAVLVFAGDDTHEGLSATLNPVPAPPAPSPTTSPKPSQKPSSSPSPSPKPGGLPKTGAEGGADLSGAGIGLGALTLALAGTVAVRRRR